MPPENEFEHILKEALHLHSQDLESKSLSLVERVFLSQHYQQMTQIQSVAIPDIWNGTNVLMVAPTASGKTEAALIPIAAHCLSGGAHELCVYMAPTKALLNDIVSRAGLYLERLNLTYAVRHGDSPSVKDSDEIAFLFTTLESFDFLFKAAPRLLRRTRWAILDEIHQLYGTLRGEQLRLLLSRLELLSGRSTQIVAMSATIADPQELRAWLFQGREANIHRVSRGRELRVRISSGPIESKLRSLLDPKRVQKLLVFANSRRRCEELHEILGHIEPYDIYIHYSSLSRAERMAVEREFARKTYAIAIATSTLELGIDIGSIDEIVLADPPSTVGSFLQRAGRGSRRCSWSVTECLSDSVESFLLFLSTASLAMEGALEPPDSCPVKGVLLQQILSYVAGKARRRFHPSELDRLFVETGYIEYGQLQAVLRTLVSDGFLNYDSSWNSYTVGPYLAGIIDHPEVHSNISESGEGLSVCYGNRRIGTASLGSHELSEGRVLLLGGRYWRIIRSDKTAIRVSPCQKVATPLMPHFHSGKSKAISRHITQRCVDILAGRKLPESLSLDDTSQMYLERLRANLHGSLEHGKVPYWTTQQGAESLTFAGGLANTMLALIITEAGTHCRPAKGREFLSLQSDALPDLRCIPNTPDKVGLMVRKHWKSLSSYANQGPFSPMLPLDARRDEVISQLTQRGVLEFIAGFHSKEPTRICDPFPPPPPHIAL